MTLLPNAFLPVVPHEDRPMRGVHTHPGFHTAAYPEIAAAYAQARFEQSEEYDSQRERRIFHDYPVIVVLDMRGLRALPDYDAEESVLGTLIDVVKLNDIFTIDDLQHLCDTGWDDDREMPTGAVEALFSAHPTINNPYYALRDILERLSPAAANVILSEIRRGKVRPALLRDVTKQYRYLDPVETSRIVKVEYMKPFWPWLIDWQRSDEDAERAERVEALGFDNIDPYESFDIRLSLTTVYERPAPRSARIEYHGTSYRRLLTAAPELRAALPVPPPPFMSRLPENV